jgi:hypothetical protein
MTELTKKFAIVIASDFKSYGHSKNTKNFKEVSVMMLIEDNIYIQRDYETLSHSTYYIDYALSE